MEFFFSEQSRRAPTNESAGDGEASLALDAKLGKYPLDLLSAACAAPVVRTNSATKNFASGTSVLRKHPAETVKET